MATPTILLRVRRSVAPLAPPLGITRIPYTGRAAIGAAVGAILGFLCTPLIALATTIRSGGDWIMLALFAIGGLVGFGLGWRLDWKRAIVFDERGIWTERAGERTDVLDWEGLRIQIGRTPVLIAPSGRTLDLNPISVSQSLDAQYLFALVQALPRAEYRPRLSNRALIALMTLGAIGSGFGAHGARIRSVPETGAPILDTAWIVALSVFILCFSAFFGAGIALMLRFEGRAIARRQKKTTAPENEPHVPEAELPEAEQDTLGEIFRRHRFHPPVVTLQPGVIYRYIDEAYWRSLTKTNRESGTIVTMMGLLTAGGGAALVRSEIGAGRGAGITGLLILLIVFIGLALGMALSFFWSPSRAGVRLWIEGDEVRVRTGRRERRFLWPPSRSREAKAFFDWTDELRCGVRRLRIDRRLLVPETEIASD